MNRLFFILVVSLSLFFTMGFVIAVSPNGATITEIDNERASADNVTMNSSMAGNVTELTVTGTSITQTWQGYFGNVSGVVELADGSGNMMYNWSLATPEGEIYASTNGTLAWTSIQCFNETATGNFSDDTGNAGNTSLYGLNGTQLEANFSIGASDVDGVNETFSRDGSHESGGSLTHDEFFTNNLNFTVGECMSTHVFNNAGVGVDGTFQEVILYEPESAAIVFAALLDDEDVTGFDNAYHDFEMLVLEDGHGSDTDPTTYFFYVELE